MVTTYLFINKKRRKLFVVVTFTSNITYIICQNCMHENIFQNN